IILCHFELFTSVLGSTREPLNVVLYLGVHCTYQFINPRPTCSVDVDGMHMNMEQYSKAFRDKEFWDKELYKCKQSPTYFWANYGTLVYPHSDKGLRAYLVGIGMIEIMEKDSDKAKKLWDRQKARIKKVTDKYTVKFLQQRKAALSVMKAKYETRVKALEKLVGDHVRLFDSNKAPLKDKKRITVLTEKISRCYPILLKYSDIYRNKKGKWDRPMLFVTDYVILLEMFYDVLVSENRIMEDVDGTAEKLAGAKANTPPGTRGIAKVQSK
ncbi:hypothetical protein LCGC14_1347950, partial [marine sediment metagenome]